MYLFTRMTQQPAGQNVVLPMSIACMGLGEFIDASSQQRAIPLRVA